VICFTIVNGARDFHTANRLTADFLSDPQRRIEDHHIFATAYLKKRLGRPAENSILNRCLIDNVTNKVISDKPPSIYLKEIEEHLGAERLEDVLTSHLIPTVAGAPKRDDADAFLKAREQLILKAVASITGAPLLEQGASDAYLDPAKPFTNELALRKVIRGLSGCVLWCEQHMSRKNLEPLIEEIDVGAVTRSASSPARATSPTN